MVCLKLSLKPLNDHPRYYLVVKAISEGVYFL